MAEVTKREVVFHDGTTASFPLGKKWEWGEEEVAQVTIAFDDGKEFTQHPVHTWEWKKAFMTDDEWDEIMALRKAAYEACGDTATNPLTGEAL